VREGRLGLVRRFLHALNWEPTMATITYQQHAREDDNQALGVMVQIE
jgi:hypothetical protein